MVGLVVASWWVIHPWHEILLARALVCDCGTYQGRVCSSYQVGRGVVCCCVLLCQVVAGGLRQHRLRRMWISQPCGLDGCENERLRMWRPSGSDVLALSFAWTCRSGVHLDPRVTTSFVVEHARFKEIAVRTTCRCQARGSCRSFVGRYILLD